MLDLESEALRGPDSIPTWGNILSLDFFCFHVYIVKTKMPQLAFSCSLWKTRLYLSCSKRKWSKKSPTLRKLFTVEWFPVFFGLNLSTIAISSYSIPKGRTGKNLLLFLHRRTFYDAQTKDTQHRPKIKSVSRHRAAPPRQFSIADLMLSG